MSLRYSAAAAILLIAWTTASAQFPAVVAEPAPEWTALFAGTSGWTGSDIAFGIPLDGSETRRGYLDTPTLFTFGDTFIGEVVNGQRQPGTAMISNTLGYMPAGQPDPDEMHFFWRTGDNDEPRALFSPTIPGTEPDDVYWLKDGISLDGTTWIFAERMQVEGLIPTRTGLAIIEIPPGSTPPFDNHIQHALPFWSPAQGDIGARVFGGGILPNTESAGAPFPDGYIYLYGIREDVDPYNKKVLVARAPESLFSDMNAWRFWDGSAWVEDWLQAIPVIGQCGTDVTVSPLEDGRFLMVFQLNTVSRIVAARIGPTPVGPWTDYFELYTCPQPDSLAGVWCYNAKAYPHLSEPGELLISYSVNTTDFWANFDYPQIYRPRFITVRLETLLDRPFIVEEADGWESIFNRDHGWSGADGGYSFPLNGDESPGAYHSTGTIFTFGDTFVGDVSPDGDRLPGTVMVNNTYAYVAPGNPRPARSRFWYGRDDENWRPRASFLPNTPSSQPGDYFWPGDGIVLNGQVCILQLLMYNNNDGFQMRGLSMLILPDDAQPPFEGQERQVDVPATWPAEGDLGAIAFTGSIFPNTATAGAPDPDGYIYIYGSRGDFFNPKALVARVPEAEFLQFDQWRYWDGAGWSEHIADCAPLCELTSTATITALPDGQYLMIHQLNTVSRYIAARIAPHPWGPWSDYRVIYEVTGNGNIPGGLWVYLALSHPHLSDPGELIISYSVNCQDFWDLFEYAKVYRPRFLRMRIDPGSLDALFSRAQDPVDLPTVEELRAFDRRGMRR